MAKTWDQLKETYPTIRYPPDSNCKRCGGTGEYASKHDGMIVPCECLFFESTHREFMLSLFREMAQQELAKLRNKK